MFQKVMATVAIDRFRMYYTIFCIMYIAGTCMYMYICKMYPGHTCSWMLCSELFDMDNNVTTLTKLNLVRTKLRYMYMFTCMYPACNQKGYAWLYERLVYHVSKSTNVEFMINCLFLCIIMISRSQATMSDYTFIWYTNIFNAMVMSSIVRYMFIELKD